MDKNNPHCIQSLMLYYLKQLSVVCSKIPSELYEQKLAKDMLNLAMNAKISANFMLRGYGPLVGQTISVIDEFADDKSAVMLQVKTVAKTLRAMPKVETLHIDKMHSEQAGQTRVYLNEPDFVHQYILPNFFFHLSMVYAIGRIHGVALSKADYDGIHQYD